MRTHPINAPLSLAQPNHRKMIGRLPFHRIAIWSNCQSSIAVLDRAKWLFKQVHDGKTLKGRSNDAIASACLYIACRQENVPRTFKEICAISRVSKKEIGRCFKLILKALETSVELITTGDFMSRFCSNLSLSSAIQRAASHIARKAVELDIVPGRSPISVAAAAIYMASQLSDDKKTAKEIADIAGAAEVTIKQCKSLWRTLQTARLIDQKRSL